MQALRAIAGLLGIGGGTYGVMAYSGVYAAERELHTHQTRLDTEASAKQQIEGTVREQEATANTLTDDCSALQQRLQRTDSELAAAREEVRRLEADREESEQQRVQKLEELQAVRGRVSALQKDYFKRHESFLEAQTAVAAARSKAEKVRHDANPLNHPRVRELLGR